MKPIVVRKCRGGERGNLPEDTDSHYSSYLFVHFQKTTKKMPQSIFITLYDSKLIVVEDFIFGGSYTH